MVKLKRASQELFRRSVDERLATLADLIRHGRDQKRASEDRWHLPQRIQFKGITDQGGRRARRRRRLPSQRLVVWSVLQARRSGQGNRESVVARHGQPSYVCLFGQGVFEFFSQ